MAKGGRRQGSGRRPKPTEMKVIQGTFRGDRHGHEIQDGPKGFPDAPEHLNSREKTLWEQLRGKCETWSSPSDVWAFNGVVSLADRLLRNHEAQRETDTSGHPLTFKHVIKHAVNEKYEPVELEIVTPEENPLITQEMKLWRELRAFIGITGLSPADRARMRVKAEDDTPKNPLERFLKKPGG